MTDVMTIKEYRTQIENRFNELIQEINELDGEVGRFDELFNKRVALETEYKNLLVEYEEVEKIIYPYKVSIVDTDGQVSEKLFENSMTTMLFVNKMKSIMDSGQTNIAQMEVFNSLPNPKTLN